MKTRNTRTKLITMVIALVALAAIWATWGEYRAHALPAVQLTSYGFGIAPGQTVRVTLLNIPNDGDSRGSHWDVKFIDAAGNTVAETEEPIFLPAVQMGSFDVSGDELATTRDRFGRIQMRAVVTALGGPDTKRSLKVSLEVFNNSDGKTTVFIGDSNWDPVPHL